MQLNFGERFLTLAAIVLTFGLLSSTWSIESSGSIKSSRNMYGSIQQNRSMMPVYKRLPCGSNCAHPKTPVSSVGRRKLVIVPASSEQIYPKTESKLLKPYNASAVTATGVEHFKTLTDSFREKRKDCRLRKVNGNGKSLPCEKLKLISWFQFQLKKNTTEFNRFVKLTPSANVKSDDLTESELLPENWPEKFVFRIIEKFGESTDKLIFHKFKELTKSRDLQVSIPHLLQLQVSPRTHVETGRTFFDPGFNLKLKLPFFHDELKFAVSTGPSFLVGVGIGIIVLGINSLFSPFIMAFKAYLLSWFFKDISPWDFMTGLTGRFSPTAAESQGWEHPVEIYEPPEVHNAYDYEPEKKSAFGTISNMLTGSFSPSHNHQYSHNPIIQQGHSSHYGSQWANHGRTQIARPPPVRTVETDLSPGPDGHETEDDPSYVPSSALKEDENFDPFYSPLLSRIDSIFMHLGFTEEGCKERAVCSIYKFPVKYAPYSNLLSAQLSKHQSELKRPVTTSPKILRYFKYMKAAKDGQASLNCIELYPKCENDTEKLSNLPMVKTFQQLSELIGTGPSG